MSGKGSVMSVCRELSSCVWFVESCPPVYGLEAFLMLQKEIMVNQSTDYYYWLLAYPFARQAVR